MAAQPQIDARRWARWKLDVRVVWIQGHGSTVRGAMGRSVDIGEGGISVVLPAKLALGQSSELEFNLPGVKHSIRVRVLVRRAEGFAYGFEFVTLSQKQREDIRRTCETLAVLQPA